jgi:murein DD-endopeptidase MepM/ murein hydrolase activator NlpD
VYLHLDGRSLDASIRCGAPVRQGQKLATAGSTGWATGPHLHFQVNAVHAGETRQCECGADGLGCAENEAGWSTFWSSSRFPSVPVTFDEWPASECRDRRMLLPVSQNLDVPSDTRVSSGPLARASVRNRAPRRLPAALGIGGRKSPASAIDRSRSPFPEILEPSPQVPSSALPRP